MIIKDVSINLSSVNKIKWLFTDYVLPVIRFLINWEIRSKENMRFFRLIWIIITFLILISMINSVSGISEPGELNQTNTKSLVMVYMVGSDLESEGGAATDNIKEMIKGAGDIVPDDLQIIVAYGGANKSGWKGMTITTYDQIKKDLENGVIGDDNISSYSNPSLDMGSQAGLKAFIEWTKDRWSGNTTYMIFWDHGSGYQGYGSDEITGNKENVSDIQTAFKETNFKSDVIGFDACLMSELEVTSALSPFGTYFVGSEETEPGSGWTYDTWMKVLAQNPSQNPLTVCRTIVDSYVNASGDGGRTLAIIDLKQIPDVVSRLDELGVSLNKILEEENGLRVLGKAYRNTTKFAQEPGDEGGTSLDLPLLLQYLISHVQDSGSSSSSVNDSVAKAIVYERHDKYITDAKGLSILDPQGTTHDMYVEDGVNAKVSPAWDSFTEDFLKKLASDTDKPALNSTGENEYIIEDTSDTASVWIGYYAYDPTDDQITEIGNIPAMEDASGKFSIPEWDGTWYYLKDTADPDNHALLGLSYEDMTDDGIVQFSSKVNLIQNGENNTIYLSAYIDPSVREADLDFRPYTIEDNGEILLSRTLLEPKAGDTINTYAPLIQQEGTDQNWISTGSLSLKGPVEMVHDILPDGIYGIGLVADYGNGYQSNSPIEKIEISGGKIVREGNLTI